MLLPTKRADLLPRRKEIIPETADMMAMAPVTISSMTSHPGYGKKSQLPVAIIPISRIVGMRNPWNIRKLKTYTKPPKAINTTPTFLNMTSSSFALRQNCNPRLHRMRLGVPSNTVRIPSKRDAVPINSTLSSIIMGKNKCLASHNIPSPLR